MTRLPCIAANAEQEELVDQPEAVRGVVRVSGPFTVEAVQPPEIDAFADVASVPEPASLQILFASALILLGKTARRGNVNAAT